jgi:hypothetical protein
MYRGLPDDRCQSHNWGYVIKGRMIMHRPEGDIVAEAGEAYYARGAKREPLWRLDGNRGIPLKSG